MTFLENQKGLFHNFKSRHPATVFSSDPLVVPRWCSHVSPPMMVSALVPTIAERCQIPQHLFYLTLGCKVVDCGLTVWEGRIRKDACLIMEDRHRGGGGGRVVIPSEWECAVCHLGGWWPARKRCFRCNTPGNEAPPAPSRPQRERGPLQRFPQHTAPADPTTRVPRNVSPRNQLRTPNAVQLRQQQQQRQQRTG